MTDYRTCSFWLETAGDDLTPRPTLPRSVDVDVAVLGGGYSGLWTAYYLLRANPGLRVAVVEREIVGFGASGRNGGWCSGKFPVTPGLLMERHGHQAAHTLMLAMCASVDEVGRVCSERPSTRTSTRAAFSASPGASINCRRCVPPTPIGRGWVWAIATSSWTRHRRASGCA